MSNAARRGDRISCGDALVQGSRNVITNNRPAVRVFRDLTAGHCFEPTRVARGSRNVFINNLPAAKRGDPIYTHCCDDECHSGNISTGSPNVFINAPGLPPNRRPSAETIILQTVDQLKAPEAPRLVAADHFTDDDQAPSIGPADPRYIAYKEVVRRREPVQLKQQITNTITDPPPQPPAPLLTDCTDILEYQGKIPSSFQLSPNYRLGQLLSCRVSRTPLLANNGLTEKQIVCNLRAVAVNILEPLLTIYGDSMVINSAFRLGTGTSQHLIGRAVDIAFPALETNPEKMFERANAVITQVPYDQFIYELGVNTFWLHISYTTQPTTILPINKVITKPRLPVNGQQYLKGLVFVK